MKERLDAALRRLRTSVWNEDSEEKEGARTEERKVSQEKESDNTEARKISRLIYDLTDEVKKRNGGKLPDNWWGDSEETR